MVTHVVGEAWALFQWKKKDLITKAFGSVGVTLPVDGSQNRDIHIKVFNNIAIGDWNSDIPLPLALLPSESYPLLPLETSHYDSLEFFWTCKNYVHHPLDSSSGSGSSQLNSSPPTGGTMLEF